MNMERQEKETEVELKDGTKKKVKKFKKKKDLENLFLIMGGCQFIIHFS